MAELTQARLEEWIQAEATGKFHYTKVLDGNVDPRLYTQLREMMRRCKAKGIAYPVDGRDGWWRPADTKLEEICWWESDGVIGETIILPLGLNRYCYIPLPSLILVAGKYNAGKTSFCINVVNDNCELWKDKIDFYVSEGAEMMKTKFFNLNPLITTPPHFKTYRKTENFSDVINPDNLSVIDYLRVDMSKTYEAGNRLFEIFNKLNKGIAIVAMQKPPGDRKIAFGGASTAFEPSLYVWMDKNVIGFEKIKVPKIVAIDPYALRIEFLIREGHTFYDIKEVVDL